MSVLLLGGRDYSDKVLKIDKANLLAYWPLWEVSGTNADNLEGTAARDGAYTGVTLGQPGIGDGRPTPLWDGSNDKLTIYSTSLRDAIDLDEGTMQAWIRVSGAGVWTDSAFRYFVLLSTDASNLIVIYKHSTNNRITYSYTAGGISESVNKNSVTTTDWFHMLMTWSQAADSGNGEVKAYYGGSQEGSTQSIAEAYSGNLASAFIGAGSATPTLVWDGYIAHVALWTTPLSADQIRELARL